MTRSLTPRSSAREDRCGSSLIGVLFPSVVLVMMAAFMAVQILGLPSDDASLSLAQRLDVNNLIKEIRSEIPMLLLVVLMMMLGIFVALRIGLRPLRQISDLAAGIGPATINQRLPLSATPREVAPLVIAFNAALDRLEAGMRAQREFSANAAHELRTPLATLRAQVESVLEPDSQREVIVEFERLARLIAQLLTLAEADNADALDRVPFDLIERARALVSDMAGAILTGGRGVAFESARAHWTCHGVPGLVEVAIRNLLENAVRHTPPGCEIEVAIDSSGRLSVRDDGPGVPPRFREHLFKRFSKADKQGVGAGLGLSIVSRVMTLHGGQARLEPSPRGACFVLDFSNCVERELP